jgi:hypothetical protein
MTTVPAESKLLENDVGTWDAEVEVTLQPGAPPQRSKGVSVARLVGERWLVIDFKNETGFEGHGVFGWDAGKQKYAGVWIDPMRTALVPLEGVWDAAARTMTYAAEMARPDGSVMRWREITEKPDADTQIFRQVFAVPGGDDFTMMKVVYRRRR